MSFEYANVPYVSSGSNNLVEETGEFFRLKFFYKKKRFRIKLCYLWSYIADFMRERPRLAWYPPYVAPKPAIFHSRLFVSSMLDTCYNWHLLRHQNVAENCRNFEPSGIQGKYY